MSSAAVVTGILRDKDIRIFNPSPALVNSVDPDQLASSEANWSWSTLFVIKYLNLYQQPGSSNLIGWKLEMGVAS